MAARMIILDTCALLWLVGDQSKLSATAKQIIQKNADKLFVSVISAFEIGLKYRKNLLQLPFDADTWFSQAIVAHGITELPLTNDIAFCATSLPLLHNDPADRFIIATAIIKNFSILTPDSHIQAYPNIQCYWS